MDATSNTTWTKANLKSRRRLETVVRKLPRGNIRGRGNSVSLKITKLFAEHRLG